MQPFVLATAVLAVAANAAMHWSGSSHSQITDQAQDLRETAAWQLHLASTAKGMRSMWTERAKLQGEHEAEQTEKALRAWLEHQQRNRLPIIQKNPDAADHVNVHAWYKAYHDPKGQSIRAWHKELAETYESKHVKNIDTALDASFDKEGRYMPHLNVPYQPVAALKCCKTECGLQTFENKQVNGTRIDTKSCRTGCGLWLRHSSLNWEDVAWHPKLMEKCQKDCASAKRWALRRDFNKEVAKKADKTFKVHSAASLYWIKYQKELMPRLEEHCRVGCENYLGCMRAQNASLTDAQRERRKLVLERQRFENHQRWMAGQGRHWINETEAWIEWQKGEGGRDEAGRKTTTGAPHVDTPPGTDKKYRSLNPVWRGVKHDWGAGLTVQNAGSMN